MSGHTRMSVRTGPGRTYYRGFTITHDVLPIPYRGGDWQYVHDDYDGAEDAHDNRYGHAASLEACKAEIDELLEDE